MHIIKGIKPLKYKFPLMERTYIAKENIGTVIEFKMRDSDAGYKYFVKEHALVYYKEDLRKTGHFIKYNVSLDIDKIKELVLAHYNKEPGYKFEATW